MLFILLYGHFSFLHADSQLFYLFYLMLATCWMSKFDKTTRLSCSQLTCMSMSLCLFLKGHKLEWFVTHWFMASVLQNKRQEDTVPFDKEMGL